ncbi:MAG: hypothetical protein LLG97_17275 [Deltaproteobacteria bacterium]|nr:hypothetical protein [Deltaproteobacteria bacterium]
MSNVWTRRAFPVILALLLWAPAAAFAQEKSAATPRPDPAKVFAELIKPYRNLQDYTVTIRAKISMPTVRIPGFTATLYFKQPDRFHVETKSFAPIPRNSGLFNPWQFDPEKNRISHEKSGSLDQTPADLYRVEPSDAKSPVRYYLVWVGGTPGRILQVEYLTFHGTKGVVKISHKKVSKGTESWLLPENTRIHLTFPEGAAPPGGSAFDTRDNPISQGMRGMDEMSGEGDVDITYSDWRINTGLGDSLFKNDAEKGSS